MGRKILVIDDDELSRKLIQRIFELQDFEVLEAPNGKVGLERADAERPDAVILDLRLPGLDGLSVLVQLRKAQPTLPVVLLTGHADVKTAVRATQLGAFDYLTKPIDTDEVVLVIERALEARALHEEVEDLRRQVGKGGSLSSEMGPSPEIRAVVEQVKTVASSNFTVLITGETGSGKELVAQAIHRQSDRRGKPFIALDCGAIPDALLESELFGHEKGAFTGAEKRREGQFHLADGGTFFLDEVGNLSLSLQAKLLRVLESRQVQAVGATKVRQLDVRFVAATNESLQAQVSGGKFRSDLYFRLAQYTIRLPPLRERAADIPFLALRFLEEARVELRRLVQEIAPAGVDALRQHSWPGNVRELRNVVRQAVLETSELSVPGELIQRLLGSPAEPTSTLGEPQADRSLREIADRAARAAERQAICEALRFTHGNKSQAARALQTDYKTLHLKMRQFGLEARDFVN